MLLGDGIMHTALQHVVGFVFLAVIITIGGNAEPPSNFSAAKKIASSIFKAHRQTLYCGCVYTSKNKVDLSSCNMQGAQAISRAHRVEWEHMMPAEHFGRTHLCWREKICMNNKTGRPFKGRRCCESVDNDFKKKESELYNLWPSVGAINQARSNYSFSILVNKRGFYGCEIEVDSFSRSVEPPDRAKGIVARANLFMAKHYGIELSSEEFDLFTEWNKQFPPTEWEQKWAEEVARIEGYANEYISIHPQTLS
jgi:deoxyribonuclease I